jgi:hypothetical protein
MIFEMMFVEPIRCRKIRKDKTIFQPQTGFAAVAWM